MDKFRRVTNFLNTTLDTKIFNRIKSMVSDLNKRIIDDLLLEAHNVINQTIESLKDKKKWEEYGRLY